jgi:hypothetical protein
MLDIVRISVPFSHYKTTRDLMMSPTRGNLIGLVEEMPADTAVTSRRHLRVATEHVAL